jgi:voltage-gated potassium channel
MYFALTTLTTVGFGDYYPVSNTERLIGSFMLLFGVMTSNFIMGELSNMIQRLRAMDDDNIVEERDLEKFLSVLE